MANTHHDPSEPDYEGFCRDVLDHGPNVEGNIRLSEYYDQAVSALKRAKALGSSEPMDDFAANWLR